jgi:deoxyadenosine/deoxycytidine kinase
LILGRLVTVVGNSGVGKTTFVNNLCRESGFAIGLEQHEERPFQELFMGDHQKYALANQIDYMLFRADQEIEIRRGDNIGVQDGGLDQDFFVFTKLFHRNAYLTDDEYALCERTYWVLRQSLPPPDLIIWMRSPLEEIAERYNRRDRRLDITQIEDMQTIEILLEDWLGKNGDAPLFVINSEYEDRSYSKAIPMVRDMINSMD